MDILRPVEYCSECQSNRVKGHTFCTITFFSSLKLFFLIFTIRCNVKVPVIEIQRIYYLKLKQVNPSSLIKSKIYNIYDKKSIVKS